MGRTPRSGDVIDERFVVEHLAGAGGMGQVYRARDRRSGGLVALKVMYDAEQLEIERFAREAQVLSTLTHPGIVRYIHSGSTAEGEPYLVMEWLSGETLATRLQRTQISLAESLILGRRVASALGAIHRRGVVHRDVKPSNLFLRGSAIDDVALIDFGMARRPIADPKLTATGTMVGTPGYIAPEQVYNVPNLDGRADIFSLGCVLYRCISGRAPFRGLRMLLNGAPDQLPRLRELRPAIPNELDDLVARMLSRSPEDRPHSGDAVAAELLAIAEREPGEPTHAASRSGPRSVISEIMATERRLMCLVVARLPDRRGDKPLPAAEREAQDRALRGIVDRHRGKLESLGDGSLLLSFTNADAATDLAARAARCALAIQRAVGAGPMAVVTGREVVGPSVPECELLDRAVELLESIGPGAALRIDPTGLRPAPRAEPAGSPPHDSLTRIDELTAALLGHRFDIGDDGRHLRGERPAPDGARLLPGDPGPCVGREQELAQLGTIFAQCVEERAACMVLLTGEAGAGKTRLGHELLRRLEARGAPFELWRGEADPLGGSPPLGTLARLLRRAFGLVEGEPIEARREQVLARVARRGVAEAARTAELLGELAGASWPREDSGERATAPVEQVGQAFLRFLEAECAVGPVVIVLEDLQWADAATIKLIDAAQGALAEQPLLVLALYRSKLDELPPQLGAERRVQEIHLRKLSRRASEQLARQVLGQGAADDVVKALVERSEGHPAYLAEMIRAAAAGQGAATPAAVLAMVQARIEKLDPAARRVLRAASVFGETFWEGGVEALLGAGEAAAWLAELVERDVVAIEEVRRFPAEAQLRFRHPLVRDAAYEMLTEGDRVAGHWLAGHWLEQAGEADLKILSDHFERCGRGGGSGPRA